MGTYTLEEYLSWNDARYELIEGVKKMMAGVSEWHTKMTLKLSRYLDIFGDTEVAEKKYFIFHAPFDVVLFPEEEFNKNRTVVQPDLGICLKEKRKGRFVIGAPEFIIEVTSYDPAYDYKIKYDLYQKAGVLEYWIVHPRDGVVVQNIFDKTNKSYKNPISFSIENDKEVVSEVIPEFSINLRETFRFHF